MARKINRSPRCISDGRDALTVEILSAVGATAISNYNAHEQILAQSEPTESVFVLIEGVVCVSSMLPDGRRQVLGFALPGDLLGAWTFKEHTYCADTLTQVRAYKLATNTLRRVMSHQPALLWAIQSHTKQELALAHEHVAILGRAAAEEKVAWFVLQWRERWELRAGRSDEIPLPMTRSDISDYLGLTIETVSRVFSRFSREGIWRAGLDFVEVIDLGKLTTLARCETSGAVAIPKVHAHLGSR
ncbi:MAG: Crp/Fnr family transcriptional regulator [Beijerinckiaceae bacterium]